MENAVIETIKMRRSIRKFKQEPVEREKILAILEAGNFAPSGHNMQPWHFTVVENSSLIREMNDETKVLLKKFPVPFVQIVGENPKFHIYYKAPQIIVVSSLQEGVTPIEDISAATQNMLLAAQSLGVGACWVGYVGVGFIDVEFTKRWREKLMLPVNATPQFAIALGYPDMKYLKPLKRKKRENITIIE